MLCRLAVAMVRLFASLFAKLAFCGCKVIWNPYKQRSPTAICPSLVVAYFMGLMYWISMTAIIVEASKKACTR